MIDDEDCDDSDDGDEYCNVNKNHYINDRNNNNNHYMATRGTCMLVCIDTTCM